MIFVCTATYALGKELGLTEGLAEFNRQLADPDMYSLPCVRTITRLRPYDQIGVHCDIAATSIAKSRSRALYEAKKHDPDVVVFVDDDVEADPYTLGMMLEAVRGRACVCIASIVARGAPERILIDLEPDARRRDLPTAGHTLSAVGGAFGLVAMSREAINQIVGCFSPVSPLWFRDDDGARKLALFLEHLENGRWLGEDVSFCRRVLFAGVALEALCSGSTMHGGFALNLEQVAKMTRPAVLR